MLDSSIYPHRHRSSSSLRVSVRSLCLNMGTVGPTVICVCFVSVVPEDNKSGVCSVPGTPRGRLRASGNLHQEPAGASALGWGLGRCSAASESSGTFGNPSSKPCGFLVKVPPFCPPLQNQPLSCPAAGGGAWSPCLCGGGSVVASLEPAPRVSLWCS